MKQIEPVQIWQNGQIVDAQWLDAICINDNLENSATFLWQLYNDNNVSNVLTQGNLVMSDEDYANWDSNEYAYNWIAEKISLIIIE